MQQEKLYWKGYSKQSLIEKTVADRIKWEDSNVELKSSFRYDIKLKQTNPKVYRKDNYKNNSRLSECKIAAPLFIGVDDEGNALGLKE